MKKINTVYAIKDKEKLKLILNDLSRYNSKIGKRRYLLFACGVYTGLRIGDILKLRVGDLLNDDILRIREEKTGKLNQLPINDELKRIARKELKHLPKSQLIFLSSHGTGKPITRQTAYKDIVKVCRDNNINYCVGGHTLRKTFGYMFYKMSGDISMLMLWFKHSNLNVTKRYIGIDLDEQQQAIKKFKI